MTNEAFSRVKIDAQLRVRGQEGGQRVRQELGHGRGVAQQPDAALETGGEFGQVGLHIVHLAGDRTCVVQQRAAGFGRLGAAAAALQQRHVQGLFHAADAGAGRGQRQMHQLRTGGDAAAFGDVDEQLEVGKVEAHDDCR